MKVRAASTAAGGRLSKCSRVTCSTRASVRVGGAVRSWAGRDAVLRRPAMLSTEPRVRAGGCARPPSGAAAGRRRRPVRAACLWQDDRENGTMSSPRIDCAPPFSDAGQHAMSPQAGHDDIARFNFLANFNKYMSSTVVGGNAVAFRTRARPAVGAAAWPRAAGPARDPRRDGRGSVLPDVEFAASLGDGDAPAGRALDGAAPGRGAARPRAGAERRCRDAAARSHGRGAAIPVGDRQPLHAGQLLRRVPRRRCLGRGELRRRHVRDHDRAVRAIPRRCGSRRRRHGCAAAPGLAAAAHPRPRMRPRAQHRAARARVPGKPR